MSSSGSLSLFLTFDSSRENQTFCVERQRNSFPFCLCQMYFQSTKTILSFSVQRGKGPNPVAKKWQALACLQTALPMGHNQGYVLLMNEKPSTKQGFDTMTRSNKTIKV